MQTTGATEPPPNAALAPSALPRRLSLVRPVIGGVAVGLFALLVADCYNVLIGSNFHEVAPGSIYRCAQLSGPQLAYYLQKKEIRTVINLRGCCEPSAWYLDECRACSAFNVSL